MQDLPLPDNFLATPQRALFHLPTNTAIISDLHLGAEAELSRRGIFMPDISTPALTRAWTQLATRLAAAPQPKLVIAGDLFDSPNPDPAAIAQAQKLLAALPPNCETTLLPGNHDPDPATLQSILSAKVKITPSTTVGPYQVAHGHQGLENKIKPTIKVQKTANKLAKTKTPVSDTSEIPIGLILGHQHPAVLLANKIQSAKMPCFALCQLSSPKRNLILLPAFSRAPLGSNLSRRHWLLDLPWPGESQIQIAGIIDSPTNPQVLDFGNLADLRLPF